MNQAFASALVLALLSGASQLDCSRPTIGYRTVMPLDSISGRFIGLGRVNAYLHFIMQKGRVRNPLPPGDELNATISFISNRSVPIEQPTADTIVLHDDDIFVFTSITGTDYKLIRRCLFQNTKFSDSLKDEIFSVAWDSPYPQLPLVDSIENSELRYRIYVLTGEEVLLFRVRSNDAVQRIQGSPVPIPFTVDSLNLTLALMYGDKKQMRNLIPSPYILGK